ncbi:MAG: class I SAM-dependent methyltransferase [Acidobacteriota bacterium]
MELIDRCRGRGFDLLHRVDTDRKMTIDDLQVIGENKQFAMAYRATPVKSMRLVLKHFRGRAPATTFVDVGCGKGSTLLAASQAPFRAIIGVEFASELCAVARKNICRYRGRQACKNITVLEMDAAEFCFPDGRLLVYFFNPFHQRVMETVLEHLLNSLAAAPRPVTLLCDGLYHRDVIMNMFRPSKTWSLVGFSVYEQPDLTGWTARDLRIASSTDRG